MGIFKGFLALLGLGVAGAMMWLWTPKNNTFDTAAIIDTAANYDTRIIRDNWGVAHIFGKTDPDTSFGLGYSVAEDDWATLQEVLIAARGMSAQYYGKDKAPADFLYDLFKVREAVVEKIDTHVDPKARAMATAYADGVNLWAIENPDQILPDLLPVTDIDILSGITWATPFFFRMDNTLESLFSADERPKVSPWEKEARLGPVPAAVRGSNAFAIAPARSEDGHTRLIINSHQPFTGPYAWFEAHVVSEEGLNLAGASFPGSPILSQGVTPHHGWAQTVNRPDLVDIYALDVNDENTPTQYRLDGEWVDFEITQSRFRVKLWGPFSLPVTRRVLWSKHGPVLSTETGHYAVKFAGLQEVGAMGQWYRMGKVTSFDAWKEVLSEQGVLSFNIVYADRNGNISAQYNARMPDRIEGPDWLSILPGDQSHLIWSDYRPLSDLPNLDNPGSGWVFSANATPFAITDPEFNNARTDYSDTFGIENRITNRSLRALAQITPDASLSRAELLAYRADDQYDERSQLRVMIKNLIADIDVDDAELGEARAVLAAWDGHADQTSTGAALAILTGVKAMGYEYEDDIMPPLQALRETQDALKSVAGRLDPPWGEINRLRRGTLDLPLDGAPDTLRAIYADRENFAKNDGLVAFAGDTHIMVADWDVNGNLDLQSIHQFGAATLNAASPHYADQAPLFARGEYKRMPMTLDAVLPLATRDYRPGKSQPTRQN